MTALHDASVDLHPSVAGLVARDVHLLRGLTSLQASSPVYELFTDEDGQAEERRRADADVDSGGLTRPQSNKEDFVRGSNRNVPFRPGGFGQQPKRRVQVSKDPSGCVDNGIEGPDPSGCVDNGIEGPW